MSIKVAFSVILCKVKSSVRRIGRKRKIETDPPYCERILHAALS